MQFAKVQGTALAALGLLLITLQIYILVSTTIPSGSPTQAPAAETEGERIAGFVPGVAGLLALGVGGYLALRQNRRRDNDETQPEKTRSGMPM